MIILEKPLDDVNEGEIARFARKAQKLAGVTGEVAVLITDSRRVRALNRRFRKKDKATDVLSFPRETGGDIAISAQIAARNGLRYGHPTSDELKILVLHGLLHLAGYDHEADQGQMAAREADLRKRLKLPASLIDRARTQAQIRSRS
ncbi:MAG: rRNA maturation RNase YbeY [Acidobacteriia bacterium]|nr:rRNA maturation RNase YbeY [Terriglobia bacterium]